MDLIDAAPFALTDPEDVGMDRWVEICTWSNDFAQEDYQDMRNADFSALVRVAKTIAKGKKVNALSEELYLEYEMKYWDNTLKKVNAAKRETKYDMARCMLKRGVPVEAVERRTRVPRDELLRMKAELDRKTV